MMTKAMGVLIIVAVLMAVLFWIMRKELGEVFSGETYTFGQKLATVVAAYLTFTVVWWGIIMAIWYGVLLIIR